MAIIDASLVMALALRDGRAPAVQSLLEMWLTADEELHAPDLLPYEVASGLTRALVAGHLAAGSLPTAWQSLSRCLSPTTRWTPRAKRPWRSPGGWTDTVRTTPLTSP